MQLVKVICKGFGFFLVGLICYSTISAQENSPFSRYGLGDAYPNQSIATRGMGGISATYTNEQALNTINPATYSALKYVQLYGGSKGGLVTYDIGVSIDARTIRSTSLGQTYNSTNFIPSYIQLGIPLSAKADSRKGNIGLVFGLRPSTRINYSIQNTQRTPIDSIETLYEGNGGLNQVFLGLGKRWHNLSIGFNAGYEFGKKDISTKIIFLNDSINYYKSNTEINTTTWGVFFTPGITYSIKLHEEKKQNNAYSEAYFLNLGASATLSHSLKAATDSTQETFDYDASSGEAKTVDSVFKATEAQGKVNMPLTYNAGFSIAKKYLVNNNSITKWSFGADYSAGKWADYRFYGTPDRLIDNWTLHVGGEFVPSIFSTKFWTRSIYRVGFYTGKDFINADGNNYNVRAFTLGFGFYIKRWTSYDNQSSLINTAIEFGKRGSSVNNVTENFFKLSVGLSLADLWFSRRKYE